MRELVNENLIVNGQRIAQGQHYVCRNQGEPVVLIHGTPSNSFIWRNVVPELVEAGHRVFLFDLLGFGESERPWDPAVDTSVSAQVAVVEALMDHWKLASAHIVGHDIGGGVAMRLALFNRDRVRSLSVIDSVSFDSWPSITWQERIKAGLQKLVDTPDREHRDAFGEQLLTAAYNKEKMQREALPHYLELISGPIGQASFFQHQVRHYDSRHTSTLDDRLSELGEMPVQII